MVTGSEKYSVSVNFACRLVMFVLMRVFWNFCWEVNPSSIPYTQLLKSGDQFWFVTSCPGSLSKQSNRR